MKKLSTILVLALLTGVLAFGAAIDGKWKSEMKRPSRDGSGEITITMVFNLKSDGAKLAGTLDMSGPFGDRSAEIKDGKIDGSKFTFSTEFDTPNGTMTTKYEGTIDGDSLKGTSAREGGQRSFPFEAKRQ